MALLETLSVPLGKALVVANSQAATYGTFGPQNARPSGDGVLEMGHGGQFSPNRIRLLPFGTGQQGQQFTMRLYGWDVLGNPDQNPALAVWVPKFLVELYCVLSNLPGPGGPTYLQMTENLCDSVTVTGGAAGPWFTAVNSPGIGSGLVAWAMIDVAGSRYLQFDFSRVADDNASADSFNCLWARA